MGAIVSLDSDSRANGPYRNRGAPEDLFGDRTQHELAVAESSQGHGSPDTALADSGFTLGGLRAHSNSISIDGLDNNDEFTGSSRTELSPEIVQEYQVVHNGLSAEFGGASGGSVNVVTRTGSNVIHGDAFIFLQHS